MNSPLVKGKIVLASSSPRRLDLMQSLGVPFEVDPPYDFQELPAERHTPQKLVLKNAVGKARTAAKRHSNALVLGVDTVGAFKGEILEKPRDHADAVRMLTLLQGQTHEVHSGLCLIDTTTGREETALELTQVTFGTLTHEEIEIYLKRADVMGNSASYAIQGLASLFVTGIEGDFFNVVGLPMARLCELFKRFDINLLRDVK